MLTHGNSTRAANRLAADLDRVLAHAWVPWDALRGARVLVTGASGFVGCWLLETLLWANDRLDLGASVVALTRDSRGFAARVPHLAGHRDVTLIEGDVRTFAAPEGACSHVVHAAVDAAPPSTGDDRRRVFDVIVEGTRRALECARASGARRFLFASSGAVYGTQPSDVAHLTEDHRGGPDPANRETAGAEAKRAAETLCALAASDTLQPVIARLFTFVGPYLPLDGKFAAGNFIRDALRGGPIVVAGDGTACRSYLYASDLAAWLWAILLRGEAARPYNVGSETVVTIGDLARTVASRFSPPLDVRVEGAPARGVAGHRYVPGTARARGELGVAMTVGLEEAISRTVEWHAAG